jgi:hypothetical protein
MRLTKHNNHKIIQKWMTKIIETCCQDLGEVQIQHPNGESSKLDPSKNRSPK